MGGLAGQPFFAGAAYVTEDRGSSGTLAAESVKAVERAARRGVDWFLWRPALDPKIGAGIAVVRGTWSFVDLLEAHFALDAVHAVEAIERDRAERDARDQTGRR